jgi:hypothetical protein
MLKCPYPKCSHVWTPRKADPKRCPLCGKAFAPHVHWSTAKPVITIK